MGFLFRFGLVRLVLVFVVVGVVVESVVVLIGIVKSAVMTVPTIILVIFRQDNLLFISQFLRVHPNKLLLHLKIPQQKLLIIPFLLKQLIKKLLQILSYQP